MDNPNFFWEHGAKRLKHCFSHMRAIDPTFPDLLQSMSPDMVQQAFMNVPEEIPEIRYFATLNKKTFSYIYEELIQAEELLDF